jgi:hypothetical protein
VVAKQINATPLSGTVLVQLPGTKTFEPLSVARQIPVGSIVDARKGRVRITVAGKKPGTFFSAEFYEGVFQVTQLSSALVSIKLVLGSFKGCPTGRASAAAKKKGPTTVVRHLWSSGTGPFRTTGRFATATIRGTTWLTADRCDGTLIKVTQGAVTVRDLTRKGHNSIVVRARHQYLARAPRPKRG